MSSEAPITPTPIVCDMTGAPDTAEERIAEWGRLIAAACTARERTDAGVRLRFRADEGIEAWVRDLTAREEACCPFLAFAVTTATGEVRWDVALAEDTVLDDDTTSTILNEFYRLPETLGAGVGDMIGRLTEHGLQVSRNAAGTIIEVQPTLANT